MTTNMTTRINNIEALKAEQLRLQALVVVQKEQLSVDMKRLRAQLEPATKMLNTVGQFAGGGKGKSIVQTGLELGLDVLMGRTFFAKAGPVARVAMPFLIRNVSKGTINGKMGKVARAVGSLFSGKKSATLSTQAAVERSKTNEPTKQAPGGNQSINGVQYN